MVGGDIPAVFIQIRGAHQNQKILIAVLFRGGDQASASLLQCAGFDAGDLRVVKSRAFHQHLVGAVPVQVFLLVGGAGVVAWGGHDFAEGLVLQGILGNQVHIVGGGVVVGIEQAVGIDEVGVLTA